MGRRRFESRGTTWPGAVLRCATVGFLLLPGCSAVYRTPTVEVVGVTLANVGLTGATARVAIDVSNPNRFALHLREVNYLLEVSRPGEPEAWQELGRGSGGHEVRIPGRETTRLSLDLPFGYRALGAALQAAAEDRAVSFRLTGDLRARGPTGEIQRPFLTRGAFEL